MILLKDMVEKWDNSNTLNVAFTANEIAEMINMCSEKLANPNINEKHRSDIRKLRARLRNILI